MDQGPETMAQLTSGQHEEIARYLIEDRLLVSVLLGHEELEKATAYHGFRPADLLQGTALEQPDWRRHQDLWSELHATARENVLQYRQVLHETLCVEWDWCKKRSDYSGEGSTLVIAVADCLLTAVSALPLPLTAIATYLVKHRVLDELCECDDTNDGHE